MCNGNISDTVKYLSVYVIIDTILITRDWKLRFGVGHSSLYRSKYFRQVYCVATLVASLFIADRKLNDFSEAVNKAS